MRATNRRVAPAMFSRELVIRVRLGSSTDASPDFAPETKNFAEITCSWQLLVFSLLTCLGGVALALLLRCQ